MYIVNGQVSWLAVDTDIYKDPSDLKTYFGKDIDWAASTLGGMKETYNDEEDEHYGWGFTSDAIELWGRSNINQIFIIRSCDYSLYGVQIGMTRKQARAIMQEFNRTVTLSDEDVYMIEGTFIASSNTWSSKKDLYIRYDKNDNVKSLHLGLES